MAVSADISSQLNAAAAKAGVTPPDASLFIKPPETQSTEETSVLGIPAGLPGGTEKRGAVPRQYAQGLWAGIEKFLEAGNAVERGEGLGSPIPVSALRLFLPSRWVNALSGITPTDYTGELQKRFVDSALVKNPETGEYTQVAQPIAPSGKWNEAMSPAIQGMGGMLVMPGSLANKFLIGAGAGELSHIGGYIGHRADIAMGNEADNPVGEEVGNLLGGALGGYANITRAKAVTEGAKLLTKIPSNAIEAYQSAREMKRQGDARSTFAIMGDNYGTLKADSLGILQQHVFEQFANVLQSDPMYATALKVFNEDVKAVGVDPANFNIAQQTANKTLVKTVEQYRPKDLVEQNKNIQSVEADKAAISGVYKRLVGELPDTNGENLTSALEDFRKTLNMTNVVHDQIQADARRSITSWSVEDQAAAGAKLKDIFEQEKTAAQQYYQPRYGALDTAANAAGVAFPKLGNVLKRFSDIVGETTTQLDPSTLSPSIRNLRDLIVQQTGTGEPLNLSQMRDAVKQLNQDITSTKDYREANNLTSIKKELEGAILNIPQKDIAQSYVNLQKQYSQDYVPRFKQGENYNLDREGGINKLNEDYRPDEAVYDAYLTPGGKTSVTSMNQFDNLFGGKTGLPPGGAQRLQAYQGLADALENRYSKTVLDQPKFDPAAHDQFFKDYAPVVKSIENVLPGFTDKINRIADIIDEQQVGKEQVAKWYKDVIGGPLDKVIGPQQAAMLFSNALKDPRAMGQLIKAVGPKQAPALLQEAMFRSNPFIEDESMGGRLTLDPNKLDVVLNAGRAPGEPSSVSGMQVLFRDVLGREEGDAQLARLRSLSALVRRTNLTQFEYGKPTDTVELDPGKQLTGQSAASWLTQINSTMQGRQGPLYTVLIGGGRFFNSKVRTAIEDATRKALYDPASAKAIYELASTPPDQPISTKTANTIFSSLGKEGQDLIARLTSQGYVRSTLARGAVIGNLENNREQKRKQNGG